MQRAAAALVGCLLVPLGSLRTGAGEPASSAEREIVALAAADPTLRGAAATRLGATYGTGAPLALVLADVAALDADPTVRAAAASAVERLAEEALEAWKRYLADVGAGKYPVFGQVAAQVVRLGARCTPTDLAAGLHAAPGDAAAAGVLGSVPLLTAPFRGAERERLAGLDTLLDSQLDPGRPRTAEVAAASLVLLAAAEVRDHGPGAAGAPELSNVSAADLRTWLGKSPNGTKQPEGLREVTLAVIGAVGRPGAEALEVLARLTKDVDGAHSALARLGTYAKGATATARGVLPPLSAGRSVLLARLGERENVLPLKPADLVAAFQESAPKPEREALVAFAREAHDLAWVFPELARRAAEPLLYLARGDRGTPEGARIDAIAALGRSGPMVSSGVELLRQLSLRRRLPRPPKISGLRDDRPWDEPEDVAQRLAGQALVALLEGAPEAQSGAFGVPEILEAPLPGHWTSDLLDALPRVSARVGRARERLLPLLAKAGGDDLPKALAILSVLARLPEHDEAEAAAVLRLLTEGHGRTATESLRQKDLVALAERLGEPFGLALDVRREAVDALAAAGPAAKAAAPALEALRADRDLRLRWHVERALTAIAAK